MAGRLAFPAGTGGFGMGSPGRAAAAFLPLPFARKAIGCSELTKNKEGIIIQQIIPKTGKPETAL
jgi:hypothetical protein